MTRTTPPFCSSGIQLLLSSEYTDPGASHWPLLGAGTSGGGCMPHPPVPYQVVCRHTVRPACPPFPSHHGPRRLQPEQGAAHPAASHLSGPGSHGQLVWPSESQEPGCFYSTWRGGPARPVCGPRGRLPGHLSWGMLQSTAPSSEGSVVLSPSTCFWSLSMRCPSCSGGTCLPSPLTIVCTACWLPVSIGVLVT